MDAVTLNLFIVLSPIPTLDVLDVRELDMELRRRDGEGNLSFAYGLRLWELRLLGVETSPLCRGGLGDGDWWLVERESNELREE